MTTGAALQARRQQDRIAYADCTRNAQQLRKEARGFRAQAAQFTASPLLSGRVVKDHEQAVRARLELVAEWCDHEADRQQQYADAYRDILGVA